MGLFGNSNEDKIRKQIRDGFDESVQDAIKEAGMNDPFLLGMIVQAAIGSFYQSMKEEPTLQLLSEKLGVDFDTVLEDECKRALSKYLK